MIYFTGILKTGGTSLRSMLKRHNNPKLRGLDHGYFYYPWDSKEDEKKYWTDQGFLSKPYFPELYQELYTYVGIVRNPFDILVSYYYHGRTPGPKYNGWANVNIIHNLNSFSDFVDYYLDPSKPWHLPPMKKSMFSFLYDKQGKIITDAIFKLENIHKLNQFLIMLGLDELNHENKTAHKLNHYSQYYKPEQVEALTNLWKKDLEYFNYNFI